MGHSLAQTVFSCIYVLRPERTSSQALLHSYCRVIRATCRAVVSVVSDARTNEVINFYNFWSSFILVGLSKCFCMFFGFSLKV
jgi:hypothetical protein